MLFPCIYRRFVFLPKLSIDESSLILSWQSCHILWCLLWQGLTECYECRPAPRQKSFPGCTIRNTPSEPIHCVVWAKHLFKLAAWSYLHICSSYWHIFSVMLLEITDTSAKASGFEFLTHLFNQAVWNLIIHLSKSTASGYWHICPR